MMGANGATARRCPDVDTLGQVLAVVVTPANEHDRAHGAALAQRVQEVTGEAVDVAFVDQGDTGEQPATAAHGMRLDMVTLSTTRRDFVVLPRRRMVERSCARVARFSRLAPDDKRVVETLAGVHFVTFAIVLAHRLASFVVQSS